VNIIQKLALIFYQVAYRDLVGSLVTILKDGLTKCEKNDNSQNYNINV